MNKKALALAAVACSLTMLLSGCGNNQTKTVENQHTSAIISVFDTEPQNPLVPGNINESAGARPGVLLNSTLVTFDQHGKPVNELAESITPDAKASAYTVTLKKGKKFSDGTPITAQSFVRAWSYTANAKNAQKCASFFSTVQGYDELQKDGLKGDEQLSGLKVVDDRTFTVALTQPDGVFPIKVGYLAFAPLPEGFYKDPKAYGEHPVSSGPYVFKKWDHNKQIELVKNKDYRGPREAKNDGVTFNIYTDAMSAYRDVQAGNLDVTDMIPASETKNFQKDPSIKTYNKPGSPIQQLGIPSQLPHFETNTQEGNLRRKAISMAIDRETIVKKVMNGTASVATEFTSPLTPGYKSDLKGNENLQYNPKKAKELWQKAEKIAQYKDTLTFTYNADDDMKPVIEAIAHQVMNTLGVKTEPVPIPTFQEFLGVVNARKVKGAWRARWIPDYPSVENYLTQQFASVAADGNGANEGDYKNPKFDALMKQAVSLPQDEAMKYYQQAKQILLNDLPYIPIFYPNAKAATVTNVKGYVMDWQNMPMYHLITK